MPSKSEHESCFAVIWCIKVSIEKNLETWLIFKNTPNQKLAFPENMKMSLVSLYFLRLFVTFFHEKKHQNWTQNRIDFQKNIHPKTITHSTSENESYFAVTFGFKGFLDRCFFASKKNWQEAPKVRPKQVHFQILKAC